MGNSASSNNDNRQRIPAGPPPPRPPQPGQSGAGPSTPSYYQHPAPPPGGYGPPQAYYPPPAYSQHGQQQFQYPPVPSITQPYPQHMRYPSVQQQQQQQAQPQVHLPYGQVPAQYPTPTLGPQPPRPVPTQEYQTTATIRNQVNLKKQSLKVAATANPQVLALTFRFDASAACRVTTFVGAREQPKNNCTITAALPPGRPAYYERGLDHAFPPADPSLASAHTIDLARVPVSSLTHPAPEVYPLVVRLEALTDRGRAEGQRLDGLVPGAGLPGWVQTQTTYAKLVQGDEGGWEVRVLKQKIWVEGQSYELQEIYGMEQNKASMGAEGYEDVEGNECVICMSEPRDTTAIPCRHMCMCHGCASALKAQTNKCPICRNEIESLLHIKINKQPGAGSAAAAGGGSQAASRSGVSASS